MSLPVPVGFRTIVPQPPTGVRLSLRGRFATFFRFCSAGRFEVGEIRLDVHGTVL